MNARTPSIIGFLTDFGLSDPFVAEMKAIIYSIDTEVRIIDITHDIDKFDVRMGAFVLMMAAPHFPEGSVHVAVVDPGVGSKRRAVVVKTGRSILVGPDNGILIPTARSEVVHGVYEITNPEIMQPNISNSFHGRDIFAPVAAHLARGFRPEDCGPEVTDPVKAPFNDPAVRENEAICEVLHVDGFGNIITNLSRAHAREMNLTTGQKLTVRIGGRHWQIKFVKTFSELNKRGIGMIMGSQGFIEIVCCKKNAAKHLRIRRNDVLHVSGF